MAAADPSDRAGSPADTDVAIIGGGLLGCALAFYLGRAGTDAVLLERGELNREASGTNAGSLHIQLLRPPAMDETWFQRFQPLVWLHAESGRAWRGLEADAGINVGVRMRGGLMVAETAEEARLLHTKAALERAEGLDTAMLSGAEARAMCPLLSEAITAADYCADDGIANPLLVAPALAHRARDFGVRVAPHHGVQAIEVRGPRDFRVRTAAAEIYARRIVVAAGAWTGRLAAMARVDVPIGPNILSMSVTEPQRRELDLLIQHAGRRLTLKQTESGTYIIGGGWPGSYVASENRKLPSFEALAGSAWVAASVIPHLAPLRIIRTWAGLGSNTPDWRPVIGEAPGVPGFHILFAGLGFTLGLVCARLMAELLTGDRAAASALVMFAPGAHPDPYAAAQ